MSYTVDGHNRTKSKMLSDFHKAISDAAALREAAAEIPGDGSAPVRTSPEESVGGATAGLAEASPAAGETAAAPDDCVLESP